MREKDLSQVMELAHQNGKEPFDFNKFADLYSHNAGNCEKLSHDESEDTKEYYQRWYYRYTDIETIKEFADFLDKNDATA